MGRLWPARATATVELEATVRPGWSSETWNCAPSMVIVIGAPVGAPDSIVIGALVGGANSAMGVVDERVPELDEVEPLQETAPQASAKPTMPANDRQVFLLMLNARCIATPTLSLQQLV
jgi:hypothetical protein